MSPSSTIWVPTTFVRKFVRNNFLSKVAQIFSILKFRFFSIFQVGTEEEPFQHKAIITMHGDLRSPELPIYGAKTLGVRNGTLDLHGLPISQTWTLLSATAPVGATEVRILAVLLHVCNWLFYKLFRLVLWNISFYRSTMWDISSTHQYYFSKFNFAWKEIH